MKTLILLFVLLNFSSVATAKDFNSLCVDSILKTSSKKIRADNEYLEKHRALVSYTYFEGDKTQEVFTETGRTFLDEAQNTFVCTKTANNPERSLSKKIEQLFEQIYSSKKSKKEKEEYVAEVFATCSRSDFTSLKTNIAQKRSLSSGVAIGEDSRSIED